MQLIRRWRVITATAVIVVSVCAIRTDAAPAFAPPLSPMALSTALAPQAIGGPSTLVPLTPVRIADTRSGVGGTQGPIAGDATIVMQIRGAAGVPNAASSVVLNVTAVDPQGAGYLVVFPALTARPETSSLNFVAGKNTARLVVARIGANGAMSIYFSGAQTHVIVDVTGYFVDGAGAGRFFALKPVRVTDSRIGPYLVDGQLA